MESLSEIYNLPIYKGKSKTYREIHKKIGKVYLLIEELEKYLEERKVFGKEIRNSYSGKHFQSCFRSKSRPEDGGDTVGACCPCVLFYKKHKEILDLISQIKTEKKNNTLFNKLLFCLCGWEEE